MDVVNSYCTSAVNGTLSDLHKVYHDTEYGFKAKNDNELFGSLILEINQAGLSWDTVLNKKDSIRKAYANFDIEAVAAFTEDEISTLLGNSGIIRMRGKITAIIHNANQILSLQKTAGSFENWLNEKHPLAVDEWIKLFKTIFKFTGKEITKEFLMGNGYLEGAHEKKCPIYEKVLAAHPKWYIKKV